MGVCQSDLNLIEHIDQHHDEKALSTERASITSTTAVSNDVEEKSASIIAAEDGGTKSGNTSLSKAEGTKPIERSIRAQINKSVSMLTSAQDKINQYKRENMDLHCVNTELNEMNGELKEYIDDKNESLLRKDDDIRSLELKVLKLEREIMSASIGNSINDILYKIQGDSIAKLKYNKMSAKRVIFINGINHLFYYDETECRDAKCIIIRDILVCSTQIDDVLCDRAWFLMIGQSRSALFIAESLSTRDKWFQFVKKSLSSKELTASNSLNIHLIESISQMNMSMNIDRMSNLELSEHHHHHPSIITSPRSGNTKIMINNNEEFEYKSLLINYPSAVSNCTILNNGHTVQINIDCCNECTLSINDGNLYQLKQFHFHTPSEHTILNKSFEMELHLVHYNIQNDNEILILCFIFTTKQRYSAPKLLLNEEKTHLIRQNARNPHEIVVKKKSKLMNFIKPRKYIEESDDDETDCEEMDEDRNDFLDQFWNLLPQYKTKHDIPLNKPLNFDFLFKTAANNFIKNIKTNDININLPIYDYVGSLRTPPYTKGVKWLISKKTHFINYKQLNTAKKIWYHYL